MSQTARALMETWFRRVWTDEDAAAIHEFFVPDGQARGLGGNAPMGPKEFAEFHAALCGLLTDIRISVDQHLESGEWSSALCTLHARSRKSGREVTITGQGLARIVDGKLLEAYNHWDFLGLFTQLGSLPPETFARALGGETIA